VDLVNRHPVFQPIAQVPGPLVAGHGQLGADVVDRRLLLRPPEVLPVAAEPEAADLQPAQRLLERLFERPPDGHRLAHALHLRGEHGVGLGEFLEGEPGDFGHHVVDRGLETGHRLAGDVVGQLVQPVADRQLGRDLGDRETGRLRGQGAAAADPRIHLDHHHAAVFRIDGELDVRPAGLHADLADHRQRRVAHPLVFLVGERLGRGNRDRVPRVNAHGIEVLDRADDHHVVVGVAHHLHFVLFPPQHRLLEQHLVDRRIFQPAQHQPVERLAVVGHAGAGPPERETRADYAGQADLLDDLTGFVQGVDRLAAAALQSDPLHGRLEPVALFGLGNHLGGGPDHLHAVFRQHAVAVEVHGQVQPGLPSQRGQQCVGPLGLDHLGHDLPGQRLDIGAMGRFGVGHDGGRIGIDQHDLVPLLLQRLARLGARVVEFAGLPDDDGSGADQQNLVDVVAAWHVASFLRCFQRTASAAPGYRGEGVQNPLRLSREAVGIQGAAIPRDCRDFAKIPAQIDPGRADFYRIHPKSAYLITYPVLLLPPRYAHPG